MWFPTFFHGLYAVLTRALWSVFHCLYLHSSILMKYWIFSRALSVHKCCFYLHSRWRNRRCWVSTPPTPQRRSSQPVAQETDGMQLQVDAEVGVDAILPPDLKITCRHQTKDLSAGSQKKKKTLPYSRLNYSSSLCCCPISSSFFFFCSMSSFLSVYLLAFPLCLALPSSSLCSVWLCY